MPPSRTLPPVKVLKTERTHEENQERAYIAASRRSDRSLEARVESARRASEIHKRRTGRSLRVTEQDVINEEMYEEEDDDLPMAYRRLTAHLQTNSADFNQRLNAYITNQVAMRTALERSMAITNMNGGAGFLNNQNSGGAMSSMFPSPMLAHQNQNPSNKASSPTTNSPTSYRHAPYPSPRPQHDTSESPDTERQQQQQQQRGEHRRAKSLAVPQQSPADALESSDERRMSAPVKTENTESSSSPRLTPNMFDDTSAPEPSSKPKLQRHRPSFDAGTFSKLNQTFTMSLPVESQMLLGSGFAMSDDPLMANLMAGSNNMPQAEVYGYRQQPWNGTTAAPNNAGDTYSKYTYTSDPSPRAGLDTNIAPSAYDDGLGASDWAQFGQSNDFFNDKHGGGMGGGPSAGTGTTPGVNGESWGNFIDTDQWDMPEGQAADGLETA